MNGNSTRLTLLMGMCGSNARSAMHAASQIPGGEPTDVDDASAPAINLNTNDDDELS